MAKQWIQAIADRRQVNRAHLQRKSDLEELAKPRVPEMFQRLCECVEQDVKEYLSTPDAPQIRSSRRNSHILEVEHGQFPHFWMSISLESGVIKYVVTTKISSSAQPSRKEESILVIAKGQDELYYRLEGKDYPTEDGLSENLLRPAIEFVEANS